MKEQQLEGNDLILRPPSRDVSQNEADLTILIEQKKKKLICTSLLMNRQQQSSRSSRETSIHGAEAGYGA